MARAANSDTNRTSKRKMNKDDRLLLVAMGPDMMLEYMRVEYFYGMCLQLN